MNHLYIALACAAGSFLGFSLGIWVHKRQIEKQHQRQLNELREQLKRNNPYRQ